MKIYLARHGDSLPSGGDDQRELSHKGIHEISRLAAFIFPIKPSVAYIFHSKKYRAKQTAELLLPCFELQKSIEERNDLSPESEIQPMLNEIFAIGKDVLLVGHMPYMGKMASYLLTGNENADVVAFDTGTLACLDEVGKQRCIIKWILSNNLFK